MTTLIVQAKAYPPALRALTAILVAVSRGSLLVILVALALFETRLGNQLRLIRAVVYFCLLPGGAAWLLARACEATLALGGGTLVVDQGDRRVEIPCRSVDAVVPWRIPLPAGGVRLHLRSGRWFERGLQIDDPVALTDALSQAGAAEGVRSSARTPSAFYAASRTRLSWRRALVKFPVFALVPTLPLFRLHQWVAYGGTFGEYYMFGLKAFLIAFAIQWATMTAYLLLFATGLRAVVETAVFATAYFAPNRVAAVRRIAEGIGAVFYYTLVPLLTLRPFLAS